MTAYEQIMAVLALFTAACVAGGWLIKIVNGLKKPSEDVKTRFTSIDSKLDSDNKRIKRVEDDIDYIKKTQTQTLQTLLAILEQLKKLDDKDGSITGAEKELHSFLINNR